jgi:phosphoribosyl-ATP pyrophosphohydrolase
MSRFAEVVDRVAEVIASRAGGDVAASWSARLIADPGLAAKKLGVSLDEVAAELARRESRSGVAEKASRPG